jgi:hypothetical protein
MLLEDHSIDLLSLMFRRTRPGVSVGSIKSEARFVSALWSIEFVNWVVFPLFVCPPFPFFWAPQVPLFFFLFYFGSIEVGSIFESSSRMLLVVFVLKFLSHSFLFPSSYQPGFFSIFSTSLSICIYPLSSRAFWSSYSLLRRMLFIWLAPFPNLPIAACLRTRTPNEDPMRWSMPTNNLRSFWGIDEVGRMLRSSINAFCCQRSLNVFHPGSLPGERAVCCVLIR